MLINQQQRDEVELAFSCCTDHEYRLPVKHKHLKTDYTTSGFSREEAKEILIEFYRDNGYTDVHNFFRKHRTSHTEFRRVRDWFDFDIKRYYRIDDGPIYRLLRFTNSISLALRSTTIDLISIAYPQKWSI